MKNINLVLIASLCTGLMVGCAKKEVKPSAAVSAELTQEVQSFRVDCGATTENEMKRKGTQAVSLVVYGNPDLSNIETEVSEKDRTDVEARTGAGRWSLYFDIFHDGDAIKISPLKSESGEVDGYRIVDKVKNNGHYGKDGARVIEISGISGCLAKAGGGNGEARAVYAGERPGVQADGKPTVVREELKVLKDCTCEFEMN